MKQDLERSKAAQAGTLLLNINPGEGFSIEPGTLDRDWMS